ncbi:AMP-binding protein, partial [Mycobacterium sp. 1164966.3]|uniref:non-ribosomal peptide synthetase n=1 Tax=Mycobacterium sp. 1164966.3 TaxID=1856861 RepID=UPI0012E75890
MEPEDRALPLTRAQLEIWLAQETNPLGTRWQLGLLVRIEGLVDREALDWAIRRAVSEAEPVRATFFEVDGQVFQKAVDYSDLEVAFYDVSSSSDPVHEAHQLASSIQRTPMPFTGPLFNFALFQVRRDEFYLFWCAHHIVVDGSGIALIGQRIAAIYSAIVSGAPIPAAVFGSLQDLVDCERGYETSNAYVEDQTYWTHNLPAAREELYGSLPPAGEREPDPPSTPVRLDPSILRRVDDLCRRWNVPRSSVITAACALLVRGYNADDSEVVLDFPVSRRTAPEAKTLPGMVAGVVPLVFKVSPDSTVAAFCSYVDSRIREAVKHQRFPVQALERKAHHRGLGHPSPHRVGINFLPSRFTLPFGGVIASASMTNSGVVNGFGLLFSSDGDDLFLSTAHAGQPLPNFDGSDLAGRLERLLTVMCASPGRRLSSFDLLDPAELSRVDAWGNRAVLDGLAAVSMSIPGLFAGQVACSPDAVAVSFEGRSMSYRELDVSSNRLAHLLVELGVGPGERVALLLPRCGQAVVAILAVLKTGAAYVPIDAAVPEARLEFMVADAGPVAALTTAALADRFVGCGLRVIDVNDSVVGTYPDTGLPLPAPEDIAYLIYTSGTTGTPKGVAVTHGNAAQFLAVADAYVPAAGVWTQCNSYGFDTSVAEIWIPLLHGGRVVVVPEAVAGAPQDFHDLLVRQGVDHLTWTPSAVATLSPQGLEQMAVSVAGEACPAEVVDRWAPGRVMRNAYGPTETTVYAASSTPLQAGSGVVPIGAPVPGAALFVLDGWLRPVPVGVAGELYVAGAGVGLGYVG